MQNRLRAHPGSARRAPGELVGLCIALAAAAGPNRLRAQAKEVSDTSWAAVERALGRSGTMQPGGVYKFGLPRSDLNVTLDGVAIKPALALGSWLAFKRDAAGGAMAMGDLVLPEDEVEPGDADASQTGGHRADRAAQPPAAASRRDVMYMHVVAHGDPVEARARAARRARA